ncbi:MAG: ATP-binding protein [Methanobacterium sp.]|jgi:nucleolar protein 56
MKCYLSMCFAGFIILTENFTFLDYELFPSSKLTERLTKIQNDVLTREEESILKRIVKNYDKIIIETNSPHSKYQNLKDSHKFEFRTPNNGGEFLRSNMVDVLQKTGFIETKEEMNIIIHQTSLEMTRHRLSEALKSEDLLLIQAINTIDEMDEITSKLAERLREWYSTHFPELDKIKSNELYAKLVSEYGYKNSIIDSRILDQDLKIEKSIGADINDYDISMLKEFADSLKRLQNTKKSLTVYVDEKMKGLAPNLRNLTGASLGAKLIAHVGGVKKLSMLPSGTIQVLGAEKALFRHLKTGERPPKHGVIFQHPEVRGAKWWIRGKIARALASKISLAVRKDVFSGEVDHSIEENFNIKLNDIKKRNQFPKRPSKSLKSDKQKIKKKKKKDKYKKNFDLYY